MADRAPPNRLRLVAALIFAVPLVALPLYAAVRNMPVRSTDARGYRAPAMYRQTVTKPVAHASGIAAAAVSSPAPALTKASTPARTTTPGDERFVVKRILDTGGPIPYGTYFWDDADVPSGPVIITVDLGAETLSVFRDGYEIGTAAIIFGAEGKDTPLGVFPITQKDAHHVSNLYDAPMPYMLRLTNDGISIHASEIRYENATHGCIGIPLGLAKKLFGVVRLGDKVIVTRGKMLDLGQAIVPNA